MILELLDVDQGITADMIKTEESPILSAPGRRLQPSEASSRPTQPGVDNHDSSEIIIRPQSGWIAIDWKELFAARELLFFLIWRDISVRYKQTVLGGLWAILQPLLLMLVFSFFVGRFVPMKGMDNIPYPVFVFAGLIPWTLFSQGYSLSAVSLINQQNLLTKVYFPRLFVPVAAACVFIVDLVLSLVLYGFVLLYYGVMPSWTVVFVPLLFVITLIATLGLGVMLSALMVFYRDFRHVIPFLTQILMFVTPVIYPASVLPEKYHWLFSFNPMFGIVTAYRSAILGTPWNWLSLTISSITAVLTFVLAIYYFRRTERRFADFA
jgi:lipopolysaccharide transport system permease protein